MITEYSCTDMGKGAHKFANIIWDEYRISFALHHLGFLIILKMCSEIRFTSNFTCKSTSNLLFIYNNITDWITYYR